MNKEEYIKQCGARTSKDLSDEQILTYFIKGYGGVESQCSAMCVKQGRVFGCDIDKPKAIAMFRQAFDEDKIFELHFIECEGVVTDINDIEGGYFLMRLCDR